MAITAQLVKELREKTGAGMMDCKKALEEVNGDIAKAIDYLREKGIAKAEKKSGRVAAEGLTRAQIDGNTAVIFEVNSETDFVAKNDQFLQLLDVVGTTLLANKPANLETALEVEVNGSTLGTIVTEASATIGEKITLRRFEIIEKTDDQGFGAYVHMGGKISAIALLEKGNDELGKDVAMQVASMAPEFVSRDEISEEYINHEKHILLANIQNDETMAGKPEKMIQGIVEGRLSKQLKDVCLVEQVYFKNPDLKVGEYVKNSGNAVIRFVRYATGEGIEKNETNFAEEVMQQAFGK